MGFRGSVDVERSMGDMTSLFGFLEDEIVRDWRAEVVGVSFWESVSSDMGTGVVLCSAGPDVGVLSISAVAAVASSSATGLDVMAVGYRLALLPSASSVSCSQVILRFTPFLVQGFLQGKGARSAATRFMMETMSVRWRYGPVASEGLADRRWTVCVYVRVVMCGWNRRSGERVARRRSGWSCYAM